MEINHAVVRAIALAGSLSRFAEMAGVKPPTAHEWKTGERQVPPRRCFLIETGLKGQITRQDLRPHDCFEHWPELAQAQENRAQAAPETVADSTADLPVIVDLPPIVATNSPPAWDGVDRRAPVAKLLPPELERRAALAGGV